MAVHAIDSSPPVRPLGPVRRLVLRLRVRIAAPRLDARLAAGEDPSTDAAPTLRAGRLVCPRAHARVASGIERACTERRRRPGLSAAIPVNVAAVEARPVLEELTALVRSSRPVSAQGREKS